MDAHNLEAWLVYDVLFVLSLLLSHAIKLDFMRTSSTTGQQKSLIGQWSGEAGGGSYSQSSILHLEV